MRATSSNLSDFLAAADRSHERRDETRRDKTKRRRHLTFPSASQDSFITSHKNVASSKHPFKCCPFLIFWKREAYTAPANDKRGNRDAHRPVIAPLLSVCFHASLWVLPPGTLQDSSKTSCGYLARTAERFMKRGSFSSLVCQVKSEECRRGTLILFLLIKFHSM